MVAAVGEIATRVTTGEGWVKIFQETAHLQNKAQKEETPTASADDGRAGNMRQE